MTEHEAQQALRTALEALRTADAACEAVGYGWQVLEAVAEAVKAAQYALDIAEDRV
jgi:hypothetical protein